MEIVALLLAAVFAMLRVTAARREKGGRLLYRQSGDVLSLRNNLFWRMLKDLSSWGLLLTTVVFLESSLRTYF